jgi:hypothetical protein
VNRNHNALLDEIEKALDRDRDSIEVRTPEKANIYFKKMNSHSGMRSKMYLAWKSTRRRSRTEFDARSMYGGHLRPVRNRILVTVVCEPSGWKMQRRLIEARSVRRGSETSRLPQRPCRYRPGCAFCCAEMAPGGGGGFGTRRHVSPDHGLADFNTELERFTVDARCAPERISEAHLDQIANFGSHLGPSGTA